ncbi:hypothetical protein A15K_02462 [Escherichia coli KTE205]|uniref:hypothetical protein n=1 Tax=Escherichia coli TaxID=562 RepID=UPI0002A3C0A2|nr:hypothetical protein A15K_02462 [Escherichia coli KTE205]
MATTATGCDYTRLNCEVNEVIGTGGAMARRAYAASTSSAGQTNERQFPYIVHGHK